jgi:GNAT superfamily N-acetyltransferase
MKTGALDIAERQWNDLIHHASIPISFTVKSVFDVHENEDGRFELVERSIPFPYVKDYDAIEPPMQWMERFDVTRWGLLAAFCNGQRVGGAVIAFDTSGVDLLEGRRNLALLWDIRVSPAARRQGVGHALFAAAEAWSYARGCTEIKIETQNINVPACRFYAARGSDLRVAKRGAYRRVPSEVQLFWYKKL